MKFQVIAINEEGEYVGYKQDVFKTQKEAEKYIKGIFKELLGIQEFHIVKIIEKGD